MSSYIELKEGEVLQGSAGKKWCIGTRIGRGRCCTVYSTTLLGEDIEGAIKIYNKDDNYAAACLRESQLLDILKEHGSPSHHLIHKLDEFCHRGHQCLIEECLGDSLRTISAIHTAQNESMTLWMIQKISQDLLMSLELLHSQHISHADLKPTNILWSPNDSCAKLADLGLSFNEVEDKVRHAVQTTYYRAPETWQLMKQLGLVEPLDSQAQKQLSSMNKDHIIHLTKAIDIWSLGRIILEMFCGFRIKDSSHDVCSNCQIVDSCDKCQRAVLMTEPTIKLRDCDHPTNSEIILDDLKDLTRSMLSCLPGDRPNTRQALTHEFFSHKLIPSFQDCMILQSKVMRILNVVDEGQPYDESVYLLEKVENECMKYGHVEKCTMDKSHGSTTGKVFVLFADAHQCDSAVHKVNGMSFNYRTLITSFYPLDLFEDGELY